MQTGTAEIGPASRFLADCIAQAFKLSAAYVIKIRAIGSSCSRLVKVDRHPVALPNFLSGLARKHHALLQLDAGNGYKWNHIGSADARMQPLLARKVDKLGRFAYSPNCRLDDCSGRSCDGDN